MKFPSLVLLVFLSFATPLQALTDKGKEAAQQLETAMKEEAKTAKPKEGEERFGQGNIRLAMLGSFKSALASTDPTQLQQMLSQLSSYFTSEAVLQNITWLQEEIRLEKAESDKSTLADITEILGRAGKTVREAKRPADLDTTIADLGKYRQRSERNQVSEEVRAAYYQIDPTLQFVTQWQNYLAARTTGNTQAANESLRSLMNSNGPYLIPRSEILALIDEGKTPARKDTILEAANQIVRGIKSLTDLENAITQLRELSKNRNSDTNEVLNNFLQPLLPINKNYQDFKAGLAMDLEFSVNYNINSDIIPSLISRLKSELLLLVLPRYVGAPEGSQAKPDEDVSHFLNRLASEAKDRGDINVGTRARETLRVLQRGNSFNNADLEALRNYVAAQNQETAGQYNLAVISYQTALKSGSDLLPSKIIGERLAAIKTEHPVDYDAGMNRFLDPPTSRYDPMRPNLPNRGPANERVSPSLAIPPAPVASPSLTSPTPTATPASTATPTPTPEATPAK